MLPEKLHFSPLSRRLVEASFTGGHITSDAGLLLLREVDRQHGLTRRLAKIVPDRRDPGRVQHGLQTLLAQRIYALAAGYEDLNDHDGLRHDYALQTAVNRLQPLAGKSTLGRLEQQADRETVVQAHRLLWEHFIAQHDQAPAEIVLDFDATDVPVHGDQEGRFFHGYYDHYCFLPLYVFCGRHLLVSYLRPSNIDGARHSWAILALLVKFIRRFWPETRIVFRGDGGFCRHRMLDWCDRKQVDYVVGLARNTRLQRMAAPAMQAVAEAYQETGQKMSGVYRFLYQAGSWR
ncbi:IS1380-like element ISPa33 family transposase, partial [Pseudomonas sp. FSL R10-2398]